MFTYSAAKFNDTNIRWSFFAINWIHCNAFNPILYFICNMWHNLIMKMNTGLVTSVNNGIFLTENSITC